MVSRANEHFEVRRANYDYYADGNQPVSSPSPYYASGDGPSSFVVQSKNNGFAGDFSWQQQQRELERRSSSIKGTNSNYVYDMAKPRDERRQHSSRGQYRASNARSNGSLSSASSSRREIRSDPNLFALDHEEQQHQQQYERNHASYHGATSSNSSLSNWDSEPRRSTNHSRSSITRARTTSFPRNNTRSPLRTTSLGELGYGYAAPQQRPSDASFSSRRGSLAEEASVSSPGAGQTQAPRATRRRQPRVYIPSIVNKRGSMSHAEPATVSRPF